MTTRPSDAASRFEKHVRGLHVEGSRRDVRDSVQDVYGDYGCRECDEFFVSTTSDAAVVTSLPLDVTELRAQEREDDYFRSEVSKAYENGFIDGTAAIRADTPALDVPAEPEESR